MGIARRIAAPVAGRSGAERLVEAWPAGMPSAAATPAAEAAATRARRLVPGKSAGPSGRRSGGKSGGPFGGLFGGMAEYFPMVGDVRAGTRMINPVAAKLTD